MNFQLVRALLGLNENAMTGTLLIQTDSLVRKVYFDNGNIVFTSSYMFDRKFLEDLFELGKITFEEYTRASNLAEESEEEMADILIKLGYVKPEQALQNTNHHINNIMTTLLNLENIDFKFNEGMLPDDLGSAFRFDTEDLIYKGIKNSMNFELIKKLCPPIEAILHRPPKLEKTLKILSLDASDSKILSYVNGEYSVKMLLSLSPLNDFRTLQTLCSFIACGLINIEEQEEETRAGLEELIQESADEGEQPIAAEESVVEPEDVLHKEEMYTEEKVEAVEKEESPAFEDEKQLSNYEITEDRPNIYPEKKQKGNRAFLYFAIILISLLIVIVSLVIRDLDRSSKSQPEYIAAKDDVALPPFRYDLFDSLQRDSQKSKE